MGTEFEMTITINQSDEDNCYWQIFCPRCHVMPILLWPLAARRRCATRPATQHPLCSSPWQPAKLKLKFTHSRPDPPPHTHTAIVHERACPPLPDRSVPTFVPPHPKSRRSNCAADGQVVRGGGCVYVLGGGGGVGVGVTILPTHTANKIRSSSQRTEPQQQEIIVRSIFSSLSISFSDIKMALVYQHQAEWLASICTYQCTI